MTKTSPRLNHSLGQCDGFKFQAAHPYLVKNPPPDPFGFIGGREVIYRYDIKLVMHEEGPWVFVSEGEIGTKTRDDRNLVVYARVVPPAYYKLVTALKDRLVTAKWQYWNGTEWLMVPQEVVNQPATDVLTNLSGQVTGVKDFMFFTEPENPNAPQLLDLPTYFRPVYPGEVLRRGDQFADRASNGWQEVSETAKGITVAAPGDVNDHVRYCRPIAKNAQNWYYDPENGREGNLGGYADPFPSQEYAIKAIEDAAATADVPAVGMLYVLEGAPRMAIPRRAFDMPEPAPRHLESIHHVLKTATSWGAGVDPDVVFRYFSVQDS